MQPERTLPAPPGDAAVLAVARRNIEPWSPSGAPPPDAPSWIWEVDHPYLHGVFAPTSREYAAESLEVVEGAIPADLFGSYVLNGPSQRFRPATRYHYYDGDAMLRAICFRDGRAAFRQRWVRTADFLAEAAAGRNLRPGIHGPYDFSRPGAPIKDVSNADIIFYAGRLLSLWHMSGTPYDIDPGSLETRGPETLGGLLSHALSAHSKVDPRTGELFFFSYGDRAPYLRYGVASPTGELLHDVPVDLPGARSPHDLGLTEHHAILHDLPFFQDAAVLAEQGRRRVRFHRELPARFGVIPRFGDSRAVRWFEAEPCYVLHVVNAWEDGDWVHQVGFRQSDPDYVRDPQDGPLASQMAQRRRVHRLHRWSFNLATGETRETGLDDLNAEFPTIHPDYRGRPSALCLAQRIPLPVPGSTRGQCQTFDALVRYDLRTGSRQIWEYGPGVFGNEAPFAPRRDASPESPEDAGYALNFVTDSRDWSSYCLVFSVADVAQGPIARIRIPHRISLGFHSTWVPGSVA